MPTISIELSQDSINNAIEQLRRYNDGFDPRMDEVCRRLAEIGEREARLWTGFGSAYGNDDVHISTRRVENGYRITMSGADVGFIEFGTGDYAGEYPGHGENAPFGIMPGDWSDEHAQQYSTYGYWYYDNVRYEGTPADMPLYHASVAIRENVRRIVNEVFGLR